MRLEIHGVFKHHLLQNTLLGTVARVGLDLRPPLLEQRPTPFGVSEQKHASVHPALRELLRPTSGLKLLAIIPMLTFQVPGCYQVLVWVLFNERFLKYVEATFLHTAVEHGRGTYQGCVKINHCSITVGRMRNRQQSRRKITITTCLAKVGNLKWVNAFSEKKQRRPTYTIVKCSSSGALIYQNTLS